MTCVDPPSSQNSLTMLRYVWIDKRETCGGGGEVRLIKNGQDFLRMSRHETMLFHPPTNKYCTCTKVTMTKSKFQSTTSLFGCPVRNHVGFTKPYNIQHSIIFISHFLCLSLGWFGCMSLCSRSFTLFCWLV